MKPCSFHKNKGQLDRAMADIAALIVAAGRGERAQSPDLEGVFDRLQASGAEVIQEPTEQPWGVRDCAFRDPAGNHVRINEVR